LNVNPRVGIFITMNVEETNGRRRDIDEVVKNHFRPAICLVPDFEQICFTVLYSEGFLEAKVSTYAMINLKWCVRSFSLYFFFAPRPLGFVEENIVTIQTVQRRAVGSFESDVRFKIVKIGRQHREGLDDQTTGTRRKDGHNESIKVGIYCINKETKLCVL